MKSYVECRITEKEISQVHDIDGQSKESTEYLFNFVHIQGLTINF